MGLVQGDSEILGSLGACDHAVSPGALPSALSGAGEEISFIGKATDVISAQVCRTFAVASKM